MRACTPASGLARLQTGAPAGLEPGPPGLPTSERQGILKQTCDGTHPSAAAPPPVCRPAAANRPPGAAWPESLACRWHAHAFRARQPRPCYGVPKLRERERDCHVNLQRPRCVDRVAFQVREGARMWSWPAGLISMRTPTRAGMSACRRPCRAVRRCKQIARRGRRGCYLAVVSRCVRVATRSRFCRTHAP